MSDTTITISLLETLIERTGVRNDFRKKIIYCLLEEIKIPSALVEGFNNLVLGKKPKFTVKENIIKKGV